MRAAAGRCHQGCSAHTGRPARNSTRAPVCFRNGIICIFSPGDRAKMPVCTKVNHTRTSINRALIRKWVPPPPQPGSLEFLPRVTVSSQRISELKMNCDFMRVNAARVRHCCCRPGWPQVLWDTLSSFRACPGESQPPGNRPGFGVHVPPAPS